MTLERYPLAIITAYAELIDQLRTVDIADAFPTGAGTFKTKTIKGRRYVYFQRNASGGRREQYVGPETPELRRRIERHGELKASERARRDLVRALRAARLPVPDRRTGTVLAALADAGVFRMRVTLVGTLAYQVYPALLGLRLPSRALVTADIDLAQTWGVSLAIADRIDVPLIDVLRRADKTFLPVSGLHEGKPTMYRSDSGFRVDLLAANRGAERDEPVYLAALRSHATPLRFLDFLLRDPVPAAVLHRDGVLVMVPAPARYACHKLVVAARRGSANPKRRKDLVQAEALIDALQEEQPEELKEVWREMRRRGPRWRELADQGLQSLSPEVREGLA